LGIAALRSGQQLGRETDLKEEFLLSTWTAVNTRGKHDLPAMAEGDELNEAADGAEPARNVAPSVPIIDSSIECEPDRLHGEVNWRP